MDLIYVNAYSVTRHYGGPEEGGWYFNHSEPLASIPIPAKRENGHESYCAQCENARRGEGEYCKVEIFDDEGYPILHDEDELFEPESLIVQHLVPKENIQASIFKKHLERCFNDVAYGDIYSVLGGVDLCICIEDHPAEASKPPRYE